MFQIWVFLWMQITMMKTVCWYLVSSSGNRDANIVDFLKKGSIFGLRECKYANTWSGGGRTRGRKSLQKHFYCIVFVFLKFWLDSASTFMRFYSCNCTLNSQSYHFPDRKNFRSKVSTTFKFQNAVKIIQLVCLEMFFFCWKPFSSIYITIRVFEKTDINFGFELDQILNFMPLLLCSVNTRDKVVPN